MGKYRLDVLVDKQTYQPSIFHGFVVCDSQVGYMLTNQKNRIAAGDHCDFKPISSWIFVKLSTIDCKKIIIHNVSCSLSIF